MYCIHCGASGAKNFCASCGSSQTAESTSKLAPVDQENLVQDGNDIIIAELHWIESLQYEIIINSVEARTRIAACASGVAEGVTGDDLLAVFDAVSTIGFSLGKLTKAILPIYDKLGIKTNYETQMHFAAPPGRVLLAALCAMASRGLKIDQVQQSTDACSLNAKITSGIITNGGQLRIMLTKQERVVQVEISATISGQWYDWGKSQGLAEAVRAKISQDIGDQQLGQPPRLGKVA